MRDLRYHAPNRRATWLELFFDLVFVAGIGVITHHLAHVHDGHLEGRDIAAFFAEFVPLWWIWASHTLFANRFDDDGRGHRIVSLSIMFLMMGMAALFGTGLGEHTRAFVAIYVAIRAILAGLYFAVPHAASTGICARWMAITIVVGAGFAGASLLFDPAIGRIVFFAGIAFEMVAAVLVSNRSGTLPVHRAHLVERVGLLSIILLGESVISLVASLQGIEWDAYRMTAAISGFVMLCSIWWIYFNGFDVLEHVKRDRHGFVLLYSHVFFLLGLGVLANMIRHAVSGDLGVSEFRWLAIAGMTLFYLGKQISYYWVLPPYRFNIFVNTVVCIGVTATSTLLPRTEYALVGATIAMIFYAYSHIRWTMPKDASAYLRPAD
ncbi:MAG: low temperature requirement protein A [Planctomycetes bacterium]|nr:low temperature requirement protein A [Planctomycetota bacterium]